MNDDSARKDERLRIGASWYPEMWPESEWPRDLETMRSLGFNIVRVFEFAWHRFEPEEKRYDTDWAVRLMDLCHGAGLQVMVGTPTAAPPAWMTARYPDTLRTAANGRRLGHGHRRHGSHISRTYRGFCRDIVGCMVRALGRHPALHSWQIDNEFGGHDYGEEALARFREWLRETYGTVERLNAAWGLEFWSQAYSRFEEVPLPMAEVGGGELAERHHPSLVLAHARFSSEQWIRFVDEQIEVIRSGSDKPITTNMCGGATGIDWPAINRRLDRVGYSLYKDVPHYAWNLVSFERMRGEKPDRPYWLLETAPNWSGGGRQWNIHHHGRGLRALSWLSTIMGGSVVLYWQWRAHWAGQEMQHGTCVAATGRWRPNREVWADLARQFARHGRWLLNHPPGRADIAIVFDVPSSWVFSIDPIDADMDYSVRWRDDYYLPMCRAHIWRDVIPQDADFGRYKILAIPHVPILRAETRRRLHEWVRGGGRLILGPLSGNRSEEGTLFTDREFGGLEEWIGADSDSGFSAHGREDAVRVVFKDGALSRTRAWCEAFNPSAGEALALYQGAGEYGHGHVAAVNTRVGKGRVVVLGCMIEPDAYVRIVRTLMAECGLRPVAEGSGEVVVAPRVDAAGTVRAYGVVNLGRGPDPARVRLPQGGVDLLSGRRVGPELVLQPLEVMLVAVG